MVLRNLISDAIKHHDKGDNRIMEHYQGSVWIDSGEKRETKITLKWSIYLSNRAIEQ